MMTRTLSGNGFPFISTSILSWINPGYVVLYPGLIQDKITGQVSVAISI